MELTRTAAAPEIFRRAAAISGVLACLSRRCWIRGSQGDVYPPCSMILVAPSAGGKGPAITPMEDILHDLDTTGDILRSHEGIHVGPSDTTLAGLVDEFDDVQSLRHYTYEGQRVEFNTVIVIAEELATFFHSLETQMMGYLCRLLDCRPVSQRIRKKGEAIWIARPALHIFGGVQPKILTSLLPGQAFDIGVTTRTMFIYSGQKIKEDPFTRGKHSDSLREDIKNDLRHAMNMVGPFKIMEEAEERIRTWWSDEADKDAPQHPKLEQYCGKRILHLFKLCMAYCASESNDMIVKRSHVESALQFLRDFESTLPEMFGQLAGEHSSADVFLDLAHQIDAEYKRTKRPVPYHVVTQFAARKVKAYEIPVIIEGLIAQEYITLVKLNAALPGGGPKAFKPGPALDK